MFCYIFLKTLLLLLLLLLLLVVCCTSCEHAHTTTTTTTTSTFSQSPTNSPAEKIDEFIKPGDISHTPKPNGGKQPKTETFDVKHVESVFFVAADGVMVALAEVNNSKKDGGDEFKCGLLAKYTEANGNNWGDEAVKSDKWKTQLATENKKKKTSNDQRVVKSSAVTVKGNKIYYITVSNNTFKNDDASSFSGTDGEKWHAQIVVGGVNKAKKTIEWTTSKDTGILDDNTLKGELNTKPYKIPPSDGIAFVVEDEKILFFMKAKAQKESDSYEKNVTAVFQLEENNGNKLELLRVEGHEKCYPLFFQWEGKVIMTPKFCPGTVERQMKVFDVTGKKFTACNMSITRLQAFLEDKLNFVTAVIEGKKVLLFMQEKYENGKGDIHLWITDGTRARDVGSIINNIGGTFYGSVIHTNNELFVLHQKYNSEGGKTQQGNKYDLTRLRELLTNIKTVITAWKSADDAVTKLYADNAITLPDTKVTDGLVGFLSNGGEDKKYWKDEYLYANATVKEGLKVENGFTFDKVGAGAKWSVGKNKEDQPYNFAHSGFTLVATVTVDSVGKNEKDNSVLGVGYEESEREENTKRIGLRCTAKGEWSVHTGDGKEPKEIIIADGKSCQQGETYTVALRMQEETLAAFVDGKNLLPGNKELTEKIRQSGNVTHFYLGADDVSGQQSNTAESHVTVTNVLLYNRPFSNEEIAKVNITKKKRQEEKTNNNNISNGKGDKNTKINDGTAGGSGSGDEGLSDQPNDPQLNAKEESSPQSESSIVRGGVVGALFSILLSYVSALIYNIIDNV